MIASTIQERHQGAPKSALLDADASMRYARTLRSWSQAHRADLSSRFAALVDAWSQEWLPVRTDVVAARVDVLEPDGIWGLESSETACWAFDPVRRAGDARANLSGPQGTSATQTDATLPAIRALGERMFAAEDGSANLSSASSQFKASLTTPGGIGLAGTLARAAWSDWMNRLGVFLQDRPLQARAGLDTAVARPWCGALFIRAAWCGGEWTLALPWEAVAGVLGDDSKHPVGASATTAHSRQPKIRLDSVLSDHRVTLHVMLEGAQLDLGQIQGLRVGDVIPLEHRLDAAARVLGTDGEHICDGWLGQSEGHLAVELAAMPSLGSSEPARSPQQTTPSLSFGRPQNNTQTSKGTFK